MGASVVVWKTFALFTPVGVSTSVAQSIPAFCASSIVCSEAWESIAAWVVTQVRVEQRIGGSDDFVGWIVVCSGVIGVRVGSSGSILCISPSLGAGNIL